MSLHSRHSIRLKGYDYSSPGAYFVTLVTYQRECLFGEVRDEIMRLNPIGTLIQKEWRQLPHHFPQIRLSEFAILPNHMHAIIIIENVGATHPSTSKAWYVVDSRAIQTRQSVDGSPLLDKQSIRPSGPPPNSLGAIIGQYKSHATNRIWKLPQINRRPIWQRNYYEHIIRNEHEFQDIAQYIQTNYLHWQGDQLNPANLLFHTATHHRK